VSPLSSSSWGRFFEEFHCRGCGFQEAYRSRPRGFFERYVLPLMWLQTVRCERCFHRSYTLRGIGVLDRPRGKEPRSQPPEQSNRDNRVA
jgi:hypothetical protein